ncbi:hypothetical protein B0H67DRAFT_588317 [Lasiosphaeris hirsuta]|uniref:FAD-dependent oxidoreductase-like enzyme n=1 Tax=Lasiosphaeris hirsuta TaxID=260670 RepID=A0AA40DNH9_9PEZI|nr:hypothetical protein B0H67DRAFT_588317 [Lasiosphaeris hirsuta]
MSLDIEQSAQVVNGIPDDDRAGLLDEPATPRDDESVIASSQQTIPSTEAPNSPIDPAASFKTELADDGAASIIPSSLTPPPSSQVVVPPGAGAINPLGFANSQRSGIFSPPATGLNGARRDAGTPKFTEPTPQQVASAPVEELRSMVQACVAEHARLRMETAHHKFQYSLLSLQADSDAKRAAVEHEMARREVEALRMAENSRQARHDLTVAPEASQIKYQQLKTWYEQALEENEVLNKKFKSAKKVIQQKEDEIAGLADERDMLLNRIRENREHFHLLCSPGGMFHGYVTPKTQTAATPVQSRATPRQTPRSTQREARTDRDHSKENFAVLLQALSQENNSAPSTPITGYRPAPRMPSKHTRNVQSMSSLPTTPIARSRLDTGGLLPSVNLVPQTEPPYRHSRFIPETPTPAKSRDRRKSRESTISAEDNEELARQALQSVAAASASFASRGSQSQHRPQSGDEEEEVFESQASQAASEMLRRDPRESFEVASSVGNSRDGTPAPADKSAKLQAKLFGGLNKSGAAEKRKFSGEDASSRDQITSPTKKLRAAGGLRDPGRGPTGLGIRYSQEA